MFTLPSVCQVCGRWPAQRVCPACVRRFTSTATRCPRCAGIVKKEGPCGDCLSRHSPAPVDLCVAAVDYCFPWDRLIARFKFQGENGWAPTLAQPMWRAARSARLCPSGALWIPIPVTRSKLASRGYNQAWELCRALRRLSGLEAVPDALVRLGHAEDQHHLPRVQRETNLRGAFAATPEHFARLRNATVVLVDDVRTMGATLEHAATALRQAGCASVRALVFAQTPADLAQ